MHKTIRYSLAYLVLTLLIAILFGLNYAPPPTPPPTPGFENLVTKVEALERDIAFLRGVTDSTLKTQRVMQKTQRLLIDICSPKEDAYNEL